MNEQRTVCQGPRRSIEIPHVGTEAHRCRRQRQIELLFKEWKSHANLHKFDTANEHIPAGLIWASLCAVVLERFLAHAAQLIGGKPISTRRVAM